MGVETAAIVAAVLFGAVALFQVALGKHWVERFVFGGITAGLVVLCSVVVVAGPS